MLRITKQADYGILILTHMAGEPEGRVWTARDLAEAFHLGLPMVSKVLKQLARSEILVSHRGIHGGYALARAPEAVTVAEIIAALDGPIAITECSGADPSDCRTEPWCPISGHWQRINGAIVDALEAMTLHDMNAAASGECCGGGKNPTDTDVPATKGVRV